MSVVDAHRQTARASSGRPWRVAVIRDGYVPQYRVRLYELLHERAGAEYVVFHGKPPSDERTIAASEPFAFPNVRIRNVEIAFGRRRLVYQALVSRVLRGRFDAIVIAGQLRFISSLFLLLAFRSTSKPVVLWGHGRWRDEDVAGALKPFRAAIAALRTRMVRLADGYLAHTLGGRNHLTAAGVDPQRVFVVPNTLDTDRQIELHARLQDHDPGVLRADLGLEPDSVVLMFVGRIYKEKRVGELLEAARAIRERSLARRRLEVVIIGDGPELVRAKTLARGEPVHFCGTIRDQLQVARYMRVASAVVIPGKVGLAANHAFAHGRPVITREHRLHSPEIEYVRHGVNGLIVRGGMNEFTRALARFVDDESLQRRLAVGALETRSTLSVESMAASFNEAVCATLTSPPP